VACMWPAREFCAAHDMFGEFPYNQYLSCVVYSPTFKSAQLASSFHMNGETVRNDFLITHDTFRRK